MIQLYLPANNTIITNKSLTYFVVRIEYNLHSKWFQHQNGFDQSLLDIDAILCEKHQLQHNTGPPETYTDAFLKCAEGYYGTPNIEPCAEPFMSTPSLSCVL